MKKYLITTLSIILTSSLSLAAQAGNGVGGLDVTFLQKGTVLKTENSKNTYSIITLKREAFEIHYSAQDLGICASTQEDILNNAPIGTDMFASFSSCMLIYKAFGMDPAGGALFVDREGANWLNTAHGAISLKEGGFTYKVERFAGADTGNVSINDIRKPIYLLIWDDRDLNNKVDSGETAQVKLLIQ